MQNEILQTFAYTMTRHPRANHLVRNDNFEHIVSVVQPLVKKGTKTAMDNLLYITQCIIFVGKDKTIEKGKEE